MAKYRVKCPGDEKKFEEICRISFNLRHFTKVWKEQFGSTNRVNMVYWEQKLDEFLKENIDYTDRSHLEPKKPARYGEWVEKDKSLS